MLAEHYKTQTSISKMDPLQTFTIGGDVTLTTTGWPASGKVGKIRVMLVNDGSCKNSNMGY